MFQDVKCIELTPKEKDELEKTEFLEEKQKEFKRYCLYDSKHLKSEEFTQRVSQVYKSNKKVYSK